LCVENLDLKLSTSKILGKPNDGKTNPEEMFAGGYAGSSYFLQFTSTSCLPAPLTFTACFASACNAVAMQKGITLPEDLVVESSVALCGDMKKLDMFLEVEMKIKTPKDIEKSKMEEIVKQAEEVCPYSRVS
jgi:organic hydroperoxide reductase OsmC/OhrA